MNVQRLPLALLVAVGLSGCGQQQAIPPQVTVPRGTELQVTLSAVGSESQVGDSVSGTTTAAVVVGHVVLPAGSTIQGHVSGIDPATEGLELSFTKITTPIGDSTPISGSPTSRVITRAIAAGAFLAITLDQPFTTGDHS